MKIGYLGPPGSYSHEAACQYASVLNDSAACIAMSSFSEILEGVELGYLNSGVIPVENSTHGAVASAMDMLVNLNKSTACGELVLNIEHCLLNTNGRIEDIEYVFSHEQAFEQCREFFFKNYPHIEFIRCSSTSQACELAQNKGSKYGAVAGEPASKIYGLTVVKQNIQDNVFNQTRFLIIGGIKSEPTGLDKTSIVFAFHDDYPGSLFGVLKSFASNGINLTRVESRPAKHIMGKYIFYIDFCGHVEDKASAAALMDIDGQVNWLKVLGSYPAAYNLAKV